MTAPSSAHQVEEPQVENPEVQNLEVPAPRPRRRIFKHARKSVPTHPVIIKKHQMLPPPPSTPPRTGDYALPAPAPALESPLLAFLKSRNKELKPSEREPATPEE